MGSGSEGAVSAVCSSFRFQFQKNLRRLVSQLYIRDNCHPFKASLLVWVQLPLWVSLSLALRNLSLVQSGKNQVDQNPDQHTDHDRDSFLTRTLTGSLTRVCCVQTCRPSWQQGALCGSPTSLYRTPPGSYLCVWDSPTCSCWRSV